MHSLKLQITLAIAALTVLFAASTLYSLHVIDQQHSDDVLVQLAGRLQFNQQHLTLQAMRYRENAPRDYPSYDRDLQLYYQDLMTTRSELAQIIQAFANNHFDDVLTGATVAQRPRLPRRSQLAAKALAATWRDFAAQLDEQLGPDPQEPRLEWVAQRIIAEHATLEAAAQGFTDTLEGDVAARAGRANLTNRLMLLAALIVAVATAAWFYRRVLTPLSVAAQGFKQVANGDFAHKVPVTQNNEIGWLAESFNHLSARMDALRKLLTRLEQADTLEGTLRSLSQTLPPLIPVDWIGVLVIGTDGQIRLQLAFSDGDPERLGPLSFKPDRTLLEECIRTREPLHIPDVQGMAALSDSYQFLRQLSQLGRRDAIFLPVNSGAGIQGVAVFASRYPNNFRSDHLALLRNLGVLVGVSLGRTLQLAEGGRAPSFSQFATGIAHELRDPLADIRVALAELQVGEGLPPAAAKRIDLATAEVARLENLLSDVVWYAKPLTLELSPLDLVDLVADTVAAEDAAGEAFEVRSAPCPRVPADRDRLRQVLTTLIRNAHKASPAGSAVAIRCRPSGAGWVEVEIRNAGEPIPQEAVEQAFEPFSENAFGGSGLALPIVKRIVRAHGGAIELSSDEDGTRAVLRLPTAGDAVPVENQAADELV